MIRRATAGDAAAIARIQIRAWHQAYSDIVDPELLAEHTVASRTLRWGEELLTDPALRTLVADVDGTVAGFATIHAGELRRLYVDPAAQGAGVGSTLLHAAQDRLRDAGHAEAVLWVFEANTRARRFYEAHGWASDQPSAFREDAWGRELRYHRGLAP